MFKKTANQITKLTWPFGIICVIHSQSCTLFFTELFSYPISSFNHLNNPVMLVDQELLFTFCQKELKNKEVNNSSKAVEVEKDQFSNSLTKIFIFFSPTNSGEAGKSSTLLKMQYDINSSDTLYLLRERNWIQVIWVISSQLFFRRYSLVWNKVGIQRRMKEREMSF